MNASRLYECTVMHRRLHPRHHEFIYRIFLFYLDLDELPSLSEQIPFFSVNAPNLYSLRDEDYFQYSSQGIRKNLELFLETKGLFIRPERIRLLTLPRLLGYTFNPISLFFCFDAAEKPLTAVIQVGNTFGELKPFLVPLTTDARGFRIRVPKNYYVSPFSPLDLAFDFHFEMPGKQLRIAINNYQGEAKILQSTVSGQSLELTGSKLAWLTLKYPLVTLKVIFLIHWEAMRLFLKRVPFRMKEAKPEKQQGAFRVH